MALGFEKMESGSLGAKVSHLINSQREAFSICIYVSRGLSLSSSQSHIIYIYSVGDYASYFCSTTESVAYAWRMVSIT